MGKDSKLKNVIKKTADTSQSIEETPHKASTSILDRNAGVRTMKAIKKMNPQSKESFNPKNIKKSPAKEFVVFKYNARDYKNLTIEKCADVINSIKSNGQKVPAIVRINENGQKEVIAGSRRLFSCHNLDIQLEYYEVIASNKQAFQISLLENDKRKNTSPWEKYNVYKEIILDEYNGVQKEFAADNSMSDGQISKIMKFGKINNTILDAYIDRREIPLEHPQEIVGIIKKGESVEKALIKEAEEIIKSQHALKSDQILNRFRVVAMEQIRKKSTSSKKLAEPVFEKISFGKGKKAKAELKVTPTKITTIRLDKEAWSNPEEAINIVKTLMKDYFGER